jgi:hypothetical protein
LQVLYKACNLFLCSRFSRTGEIHDVSLRYSGTFEKCALSVIPAKPVLDSDRGAGIHNKLKMLVLDLIGDWILVYTGMTI